MASTDIAAPPRLDIARLPTTIRRLERMSAKLESNLWVKHDDETGSLLSGNKIRKLQYVVREAIDAEADTLVTCGGLQSNHCRTTAALARRVGLDVVLCLRGAEPERWEGNYLLDRMLGAKVRWLTPEQYEDNEAVMADVAEELRREGRRPWVIAEGASMPMGCWGYIEAVGEIAAFQRETGIVFDRIVCACGSGGTGAGLELGVRVHELSAVVQHMAVCDDAAYFRRKIGQLCTEAARRFSLGVVVEDDAIVVDDGYIGGGYGVASSEQIAAMQSVAREDGLVLDPVYSGKAFYGLCERARGSLPADGHTLFVHTGGVFGLFPFAEQLGSAN